MTSLMIGIFTLAIISFVLTIIFLILMGVTINYDKADLYEDLTWLFAHTSFGLFVLDGILLIIYGLWLYFTI